MIKIFFYKRKNIDKRTIMSFETISKPVVLFQLKKQTSLVISLRYK